MASSDPSPAAASIWGSYDSCFHRTRRCIGTHCRYRERRCQTDREAQLLRLISQRSVDLGLLRIRDVLTIVVSRKRLALCVRNARLSRILAHQALAESQSPTEQQFAATSSFPIPVQTLPAFCALRHTHFIGCLAASTPPYTVQRQLPALASDLTSLWAC
jgi:hypothetical protein